MQLEGLSKWHVIWFFAWTFVLLGIISSPTPYTLNWAFASEILDRVKQGGETVTEKSGQWAESTDKWSKERWEKQGRKEVICYDSSSGKVCK